MGAKDPSVADQLSNVVADHFNATAEAATWDTKDLGLLLTTTVLYLREIRDLLAEA
jgi:hypothetical protein